MPQAPNIEGLPLWLQISLSLLFGAMTIIVGVRGYKQRDPVKHLDNAQIIGAHIADMGAIRHLSDTCSQLSGDISSLEQAIREQTHWDRDRNELLREMNARMRELRDLMRKS
jgi:hypothetical protein